MTISETIISWYYNNARELPWRKTTDPYTIWVSEIIMQQTRVEQGLPYYIKFLENFPTVYQLAEASEEKVLLIWQGLGYYSRARNMQHTAKEIVLKFNGKFPDNSDELIKLKGIGKYTAAAISSICNKENIAAIDGNVIRVISRLFNIQDPVNKSGTLKTIDDICEKLIKNIDAATFNQALMDIGATICTPKKTKCLECPLTNKCEALATETVDRIPLKEKKISNKNRYFVYLIIQVNDEVLIKKRNKNDIWKGLYEFPLIEFDKKPSLKQILKHPEFNNFINTENCINMEQYEVPLHKLSHQTIHTTFIKCNVSQLKASLNFTQINISDLSGFAFPQLIQKHIPNIMN